MFDAVEKLLYWLTSFVLHADVDAHVQVLSPIDTHALQTVDQGLMSVIELKGVRQLVGEREFAQIADNLAKTLAKTMKAGNGRQHSYAFGFRSSPQDAPRRLAETFRPMLQTARRFGARRLDPILSQVQVLGRVCNDESQYLVFYTHKQGLSTQDLERNAAARMEMSTRLARSAPGSRVEASFAQPVRIPPSQVITRHNAAIQNVIADLSRDLDKNGCCLLVELLECDAALSLMRRHMDASGFPSSWRPRLIGSKSGSRPQSMASRKGDASHLLPLALSRQMAAEGADEFFDEVEYVRRGKLLYAGFVMEVPPEDGAERFLDLMDRLGRQIPISAHFEVVPNGERDVRRADRTFAAWMGALSDHNKAINAAWKHLQDMKKGGYYICGMRVLMVTWAESKRKIIDNLSFLKATVESWGSASGTNETGSPALLSYAAAAGFCRRMPAPYMPGPIEEFAKMLPVFSPASVWDSGQLVTHTKQGRAYPIAFGTPLQNFWGTTVFAPSGFGKSFFMNMMVLGILFSAGLENVPYMTLIDVGPSLKLALDIARSVLPERIARQIVSVRLRNDPSYCINFFDTHLGCDRPTEVDRDFAISVVMAVCPSLGAEGDRFVGQVVDAAYRLFGRRSAEQRRWQVSLDGRVTDALKEIGFEAGDGTFVWEVVDALMDAGRPDDAALAQRYAMPRLQDLVKAARTREILDSYKATPSATSESLLDVFTRGVQTAQSSFQLVSGFTKFDVGNARVVSVDLEEVVTATETDEGKRRAAVMFLFSRRLGARNYFLRWDELEKLVPDRYRAYQRARVQDLQEMLKFLLYDELHYASGIEAMARQLEIDSRVARKYTMVPIMSSQMLADFPAKVMVNCYTRFVLGVGSKTSLNEMGETFGLTPSELEAIRTECTGPGTLFASFNTRKGQTSQILKTTASPMLTWAFNTDRDDAMMRAHVTERLDGDLIEALARLTAAFPKGSYRDDLARYRRSKGEGVAEEGFIERFARMALEAEPVSFGDVLQV
jgi:intracellular multiplication protein IcmB